MEKYLKLVFLTGEGKDYTLTLPSPKAGLTKSFVENAMDDIVTYNIIESAGTLIAPKEALLCTTSTSKIQ